MEKQILSKQQFDKKWTEISAKNKLESEKSQLVIQSIKESQQRSKNTQNMITETLSNIKQSLSDISTTEGKIEKFKSQYQQALRKLAIKFSQTLINPIKRQADQHYQYLPIEISMQNAVKKMLKYDNILFLTGAGISAASGIPTFRGEGGLYTSKINVQSEELEPTVVLTKSYYDKNPQVIWKWLDDFHKLVSTSKPNNGHLFIHQICQILAQVPYENIQKKKKITLVTQNLDNLHYQSTLYPKYHIHGDIRYIRCDQNMHLSPFSTTQKICKQCSSSMRPHVLFFDESYRGLYGGDIKDNTYEFVVSIGTMLQTNLALNFVKKAIEVIQINKQPIIEVGRVYPFKGDAGHILEQMYMEIKRT